MSNGVEIRWADEATGEIVNGSGQTLHRLRVQVVGLTRIQGRRAWTVDVPHWHPGAVIRLVRVELRGAAPAVRLRFQLGELSRSSGWYMDHLPLRPPVQLEPDPWSLGARVRPKRY